MRVPFHTPDIGDGETDALYKAAVLGHLAHGPSGAAFERAVAALHGFEHAVAVSSCTSGFACIFEALNVDGTDCIAFPSYTFTGPAMQAVRTGAGVVLVDSLKVHPNLDPADLRLHDRRTPFSIVCPTLFAGEPVDDDVFAFAREKGALLILDAAQAAGSRLTSTTGEKPLAAVLSTYATKPLTTGTGGVILTDHGALADDLRQIRLHGFSEAVGGAGQPSRHESLRMGYKANLPELNAAMGIVQAGRMKAMEARRYEIAARYSKCCLELGIDHLELTEGGNAHLFVIQAPGARDKLAASMLTCGVQTSVHFLPLHRHRFYRDRLKIGDTWGRTYAERHYERALSLPISSRLYDAQVESVCDALAIGIA